MWKKKYLGLKAVLILPRKKSFVKQGLPWITNYVRSTTISILLPPTKEDPTF